MAIRIEVMEDGRVEVYDSGRNVVVRHMEFGKPGKAVNHARYLLLRDLLELEKQRENESKSIRPGLGWV